MAVIGWVEVAEATKWTGDPDVDAAVGELTVTPAKDAAASVRVVNSNRITFFTPCTPSEVGFVCSEGARLRVDLLWMYQETP